MPNTTIPSRYVVVFTFRSSQKHGFSTSSESVWTDYPIENAYELLEVSETSSFDEIKASFRKLAKETHPDLAESRNDSTASRRFVQILAAYEVRANRFLVFFYGYSLRVGIVGEILFTSKICYEIFLIEELIMPRKLCLRVNLD
jgi:curved DNA-binding protein CbpA